MQRYDSYKDSGIYSIGRIPSHWKVLHLRNFLFLFSEKGHGDAQLLSVTRERGVILRDKDNKEENHNFVPDDLSGYKFLKKGDFVINKMKSWQGSYGVSDYDGIVSPAYFTCKLKGVNPKFFSRAIRSKAYIGFFMQFSKGIRVDQWDLDPSSMKDIPFILPPEEEQEPIVQYLDAQTAQIDEAIAQQQKMIDLLNERKQIIINNAVTKGLNPDVPMKDSGVEWIGMIPSHWKVVALLRILRSKISDGPHETPDYVEEGIPFISIDSLNNSSCIDFTIVKRFITSTDFERFSKKTILEEGDVLFSKAATIGKTAIVGKEKFMVWSPLAILKPNFAQISSKFLYYILNIKRVIDEVSLMGSKNTQINVGMRELEKLRVVAPPLSEQNRMVEYLDVQTAQIDEAIAQQQKMIDLLNERKQIIINEVVTGKIKV